MNMRNLHKLILLFFIVFVFIPKGYSQNSDPGIGILMDPASVTQGSTGILRATVGNYGNNTIVSNSLRVTISVGASAEIMGIASGSDARWSQLSLSNGSGNTIQLTNTGGGFTSFDIGDILITVRGNTVSDADGIAGNFVYITANNPLLCAGCASPPLNASQGNASNSNDNSETSLVITCATPNTPTVGTITQPTCSVATGSVALSGLPTGTWTVTGSPSGTATGTGTSTTISGLAAGTYTFTVTNANGCASVASANVTVNAQPPIAPTSGGDQAVCTDGTTTQTLTATATGGTITWYDAATAGNIVTSPTQVGVGTKTYYAQASNGTCSSLTRTAVTLTIASTLAQPTSGAVTQPTCTTATGSFSITNYNSAYTYVVSPSTGVSVSGNTVTAPAGSYTVTATLGTCTSIASASVTVNAQPAIPNAPTSGGNQTVCSDGTTNQTLTAAATGGSITWYDAATAGNIITSPTQVGVGTKTYYAQASNSTCSSLTRTAVTLTINNCSVIIAVVEIEAAINGLTGGTTLPLTLNDLLNGAPVVIGTAPGNVSLTGVTVPAGFTLNANGTITIAPNTPAGNYSVTYRICEVSNPTNCSSVTSTIVVFRLLNGQVNLSVSKTSFGAEIFEGDEFEYQITLSNIGGTPATNVELVDDLPNAVTYISSREESVSGSQIQIGTPAITGNRITWKIPFLPANDNVVIRVRVKAGTAGTITNVARIIASEDDLDVLNNQATDVNQIISFHISNVITPNNDGDNDTFEIQELGKFASSEIVIFNRYGDHVFEKKEYKNDWNASGQLAGTYFYVLTTVDNSGKAHAFKGWIQVIKD
jgi:gliding motility-associated-like protein/uncharacterized repeat protein (TIGR01451 family)